MRTVNVIRSATLEIKCPVCDKAYEATFKPKKWKVVRCDTCNFPLEIAMNPGYLPPADYDLVVTARKMWRHGGRKMSKLLIKTPFPTEEQVRKVLGVSKKRAAELMAEVNKGVDKPTRSGRKLKKTRATQKAARKATP